MPLEGRDDDFGDRDDAHACPGLGRPEGEPAAADLGQLPDNAHGAGLQVDVATAERAQLAPAQATERGQQPQGAVSLPYRVGERNRQSVRYIANRHARRETKECTAMTAENYLEAYEASSIIDAEWTEEDWYGLMCWLINAKLVSWKEVTSLVLGHLNPSQVGTSIASKKSFQSQYPPRQTMQAVYRWHNAQSGKCADADCGTRLELQADHVNPRQTLGDEADRLSNMTLRCRRCNVIRRPSHQQGGLTFLTTESALMWILFTKRPRTYQEYEKLCRAYGLTMANVRFHEAWAMAHWLAREGLYEIDESSSF